MRRYLGRFAARNNHAAACALPLAPRPREPFGGIEGTAGGEARMGQLSGKSVIVTGAEPRHRRGGRRGDGGRGRGGAAARPLGRGHHRARHPPAQGRGAGRGDDLRRRRVSPGRRPRSPAPARPSAASTRWSTTPASSSRSARSPPSTRAPGRTPSTSTSRASSTACARCCRRCAARARASSSTSSSGAAHNPLEGWSHYCAAKAADRHADPLRRTSRTAAAASGSLASRPAPSPPTCSARSRRAASTRSARWTSPATPRPSTRRGHGLALHRRRRRVRRAGGLAARPRHPRPGRARGLTRARRRISPGPVSNPGRPARH